MTGLSAEFANQQHTFVKFQDGGMTRVVPASNDNADYRDLMARLEASGGSVAPFNPPRPTIDHVNLEASRRINAILGVGSDKAAILAQTKALERMTAIMVRKALGQEPNADEVAYLSHRTEIMERIETVRSYANSFPAEIPLDYTHDRYWGQ